MSSDEYDILAAVKAVEGQAEPRSENEFLNFDSSKMRQCRFCLKTDPDKFRNKSHTLPLGLGNRWHISWDECDLCNAHFNNFDPHLCNALGIFLTYCGIQGRNGVRSTGRKNDTHIITHTEADGTHTVSTKILDRRLGIEPSEGSVVFLADGTVTVVLPTPDERFTPRKAFKALMKIGLAILPLAELSNFQKLREWIQTKDDDDEFPFLKVSIAFDEIINAPKVWSAAVHRRRAEISHVPYCRLVFTVGPVCIVADLLPDSLDDHIGLQCLVPEQTEFNFSFELADGSYADLHFKNFEALDWSSSSRVETPIAAMVALTNSEGINISIYPQLR